MQAGTGEDIAGGVVPVVQEKAPLDVSLVQRHLIRAVWPRVKGLLEKATDLSIGRYDIDDVQQKLIDDPEWHLFVIYEPDLHVIGAVVSSFSYYPKGKFLCAQFAGGERLMEWKDLFLDMFDNWGRDNGCTMIEIGGRTGWKRVIASNGYSEAYRVYQREL